MIKQIENKVKKYIEKYNLIEKGNHIVVGVSGGADSMMLLHFLDKYKEDYEITLQAAHIHHGMRIEASRDAEYVEKKCLEWNIPFNIHYCCIKEIAIEKGITEEEAGRLERYNFFISLTKQDDKIATAHNKNDQAETLIMRFLRGTDIRGLGGIPPRRDNIIRPLLDLERREIEYYCEINNIRFKDDHTNFMPIYTRNKIRLKCIPYIQEHMNTNIINTLADHSQLYREEEEFLQDYIEEVFREAVCIETDKMTVDINRLIKEKVYIQKKLFLYVLSQISGQTKDITLIHIQKVLELLQMQSGKRVSLPYHLTALRQYDNIIVLRDYKDIITNYDYTLEVGINNIEEIPISLNLRVNLPKTVEQTMENMYTKYIDYDKIKDSLHIRTRREGDIITLPIGSKKLKRFFIDQKVPSDMRNTIPLVVDDNEVVWVIGSRLSSKYYVTDQTTRVLEMKVIKKEESQEGLC
ncbi:MAG: tRNA lysidine(34) synthetase TilS [Cellulosilyticaceae bacterium]